MSETAAGVIRFLDFLAYLAVSVAIGLAIFWLMDWAAGWLHRRASRPRLK